MKRIAVIEDNEDNQILVQAILEPRYEVDLYSSGPQGLDGLERRKPNLLLLDVSLPGMDGVEVLAKLRQHQGLKDLPVIALTAHAMEGDRERFLAAGFDGYVSKPIIDEDVLFHAVEQLLGAGE